MPSSTISLEPLSSPSPSPPPPPLDTRASTSNNSGAGAGLDSGSELSELTEDEPENSKADREDGRRPTKRKKRGGMIPEPMWQWAYGQNKRKDSKSKDEEDEDEEEQLDPRSALGEEDDDERGSRSRSTTAPPPNRQRRRLNGGASAVIRSDDEDDREHDQEDDTASADEASAPLPLDDNTNDLDYASEDEDGVDAVRADAAESREPGGGKVLAELSDDENVEDDDGAPADEDPPDMDDPANDNAAGASDEDAIVQPAPSTAPLSATPSIPNAPAQVTVDRDVDPDTTLMDVDDTAPVPTQVPPIIAAAAASSIMAGAEVVDPPSPSPSASSASGRNQSRSPSRSPSPEQVSDREVEPKRAAPKARGKPRSGRTTRNRTAKRKAKGDLDPDLEAEHIAEVEPEDAEDLDEGDLDSPELDMEMELQPAHRAEALDVLATIELKYALLRESLYVEKMEALSWEESLVHNGIHPEMTHLQRELSNRRDKRLELAGLRRDYERANVTKRRKLDEDGVWSWWKLRRDELQTEMISDTHRKRRQLDRERRVLERPQPIRRIPSPPREIGAPPTLRDLVKASPFDSTDSSRRPAPPNALAYPLLSALAPAEIASDIELLFGHRRNAGFVGGLYGFPGVPPGFDQYNMGMPMLDGPGAPNRLPPHMAFQQGPMLPHGAPPPPSAAGYHNLAAPPPPRLQHHHSAPSGSIPMAPQQMLMDQEFAGVIHRSGSGATHAPSQMQQYPQAGPSSRNRRSPSPIPVHNMTNGSGVAMASSSKAGRMGASASGSTPHGMKEMKRGEPMHHGIESEAIYLEKERERERREAQRDEREWARDMERERQVRQQRDMERDREQYEREMDRSGHPVHPQRHSSHSHQHAHSQSERGAHSHGPHHHHHHHHVVHHHHSNGLGPNGPSQAVPPREPSNGVGPGVSSPRPSRDVDLQRGHPVPVEVIELTSAASLPAPSHAHPRKVNEEQQPPLHPDSGRDRARGPPAHPIHDRPNLPFVSPPMQSSQSAFPPSPRAGHGLSTAPASVAPSRRGSWSAPDGAPVPRPSSSSSTHLPSLSASQRMPASALPSRQPQLSPSQPHRSPMLSPPRNGAIRLPPLSPPQTSILRSPPRTSQALPGIPLTVPGSGHSKSLSPKVSRRATPPPSRPRSPLTRERSLSGVAPSSIPTPGQKHSRMSPVSIFPAPVSQPTPLPTSRLPNVGVDHEASLASPPKLNPVPID